MTPMMWLATPLLLAAPAPASDAFALKIKQPSVGEAVLVERTQTTVTKTKHVDNDGKSVSDVTETYRETYVFRETILAQETGKPATKIRREYEKAKVEDDGDKSDLPYDGKTVLIEKQKDGKYRFTLEGGKELSAEDASALDGEFNVVDCHDFEQHFLPSRPVKVDEAWKLDLPSLMKIIAPMTNTEGDVAKAKGEARLIKAYSKEDRSYGHFTARIEFPITASTADKEKTETLEGSRIIDDNDFDACIDGEYLDFLYNDKFEQEMSVPVKLGEKVIGKVITSIRGEMRETDKEMPKK